MKHRAPVTAGLYLLFKKLVEGVNSSGRSSSSQRTKVMRGVWAGFQTPHPLPASLQGTMNSLDSNSPDDAFPEFLSPVRSTFHGKKLIVVFVFSPSKGPDVMWCETFLFNLHENRRLFILMYRWDNRSSKSPCVFREVFSSVRGVLRPYQLQVHGSSYEISISWKRQNGI